MLHTVQQCGCGLQKLRAGPSICFPQTAGAAPKVFTLYSATYMLFTTPKNWSESVAACSVIGFNLPTIYSAEHANQINEQVRKHIAATALYWTGASDAGLDGTWKWADGAAGNLGANGRGPGGWNPWTTGQPDGGSADNCVAAGGGTNSALWGDARCSNQHDYVCVLPGKKLV
jgi:hypothetical protein